MAEPMNDQRIEWEVRFFAGDAQWRHYKLGTREEVEGYAASLCYDPTTRYVLRPASPIKDRAVSP